MTDISDSRDIAVTVRTEPTGFDDIEIIEAAKKFRLRDYRGPVDAMDVELHPHMVELRIILAVADVATGLPTSIQSVTRIPRTVFCDPDKSVEDQLGCFLRGALQEMTLHELDENFMRGEEHFVDPHPEQKLKKKGRVLEL